jgi:hypothetical protein
MNPETAFPKEGPSVEERAYCDQVRIPNASSLIVLELFPRRSTHDSDGVSSFISTKEIMNDTSSVGERGATEKSLEESTDENRSDVGRDGELKVNKTWFSF